MGRIFRSVSSIRTWALNMKSRCYIRPGSGNFWRKVHNKWRVSSSDFCVAFSHFLLCSRIMALSADNLVVECWLYGWLVILQCKGESSLISIISIRKSYSQHIYVRLAQARPNYMHEVVQECKAKFNFRQAILTHIHLTPHNNHYKLDNPRTTFTTSVSYFLSELLVIAVSYIL